MVSAIAVHPSIDRQNHVGFCLFLKRLHGNCALVDRLSYGFYQRSAVKWMTFVTNLVEIGQVFSHLGTRLQNEIDHIRAKFCPNRSRILTSTYLLNEIV